MLEALRKARSVLYRAWQLKEALQDVRGRSLAISASRTSLSPLDSPGRHGRGLCAAPTTEARKEISELRRKGRTVDWGRPMPIRVPTYSYLSTRNPIGCLVLAMWVSGGPHVPMVGCPLNRESRACRNHGGSGLPQRLYHSEQYLLRLCLRDVG